MKKQILIGALTAQALLFSACSDQHGVLTVDGESTTREAFDAYLAHKNVQASTPELKQSQLKRFADREALAKAIENSGRVDTKALDAEVADYKRQIIINRYFSEFVDQNVSDQAVQNYYQQNQAKYASQQAKVSHMLFRVNPEMSEAERLAKQTKARDAKVKVMTGQPFTEVAQALSEDKLSAKKGGSLGWLKTGSISPEFSDLVFNELKKGEVSEPILTTFGYHIVMLDEPPKTVKQPLESVAGQIKYALKKEAKEAEEKRLRDTVKVKINTAAL